ncbi:MAG: glycosyltransferase family 1 protein [Fimbriimonadaceae bacterium]
MRILLIGPYPPDRQYSIQAFTAALARGLGERGWQVSGVEPTPSPSRSPIARLFGPRVSTYDKFVRFPRRLAKMARSYDLVHVCEHGYALYTSALAGVPHVVTAHDLIVAKAAVGMTPDWPLSPRSVIYQRKIVESLRRCPHVVAVSEATRDDVVRLAGRSPDTVAVIPNGLYRPMRRLSETEREAARRRLGFETGTPIVLHVGGNQPNKNRLGVVEIFGHLAARVQPKPLLVLAGPNPDEPLRRAVDSSAAKSSICVIASPSDDDVVALYNLAHALLFPSLDEGFGLPIIEAQACGCPVVTSDRRPMRDVAGDSALLVDPLDAEGAAARVAQHWDELPQRIEGGLQNAARYSTETMVDRYAQLFSEIVSAAAPKETSPAGRRP